MKSTMVVLSLPLSVTITSRPCFSASIEWNMSRLDTSACQPLAMKSRFSRPATVSGSSGVSSWNLCDRSRPPSMGGTPSRPTGQAKRCWTFGVVRVRGSRDAEGLANQDLAPRRGGLVDGGKRPCAVANGAGLLGLEADQDARVVPGSGTTGRWMGSASSTKRPLARQISSSRSSFGVSSPMSVCRGSRRRP